MTAKRQIGEVNVANPCPSAPKHAGKYVFYYSRKDEQGLRNVNVVIWAAAYAAKHFLRLLKDGNEVTWLDDDTWEVGPLQVQCDQMEFLWRYKFANDDERNWVVPEPYRSSVMRTLGKRVPVIGRSEIVSTVESLRSKKVRKPKSDRKPRASREGLISVQQIASELKTSPRECRIVLRALKLTKPEAGWAWPAAEAKKIKPMIEKGLKRK